MIEVRTDRRDATRMRASVCVITALFAAAIAGCGLGDYEECLSREQGRLARLQDEQSRLTSEIAFPKDEDPVVVDPLKPPPPRFPSPIYYRPPIGINSQKPHVAVTQLMYWYPLALNAPFPQGTIQRMDVAASSSMNQQVFVNEIGPRLGLTEFKFTPVVVQSPYFGDRTFDRASYASPSGGANYMYFYDDPQAHWQVAIVFESARQLDQDLVDRLEYSLKTLGVGPEVGKIAGQSRLSPRQ